jgi:hypothetical protein
MRQKVILTKIDPNISMILYEIMPNIGINYDKKVLFNRAKGSVL